MLSNKKNQTNQYMAASIQMRTQIQQSQSKLKINKRVKVLFCHQLSDWYLPVDRIIIIVYPLSASGQKRNIRDKKYVETMFISTRRLRSRSPTKMRMAQLITSNKLNKVTTNAPFVIDIPFSVKYGSCKQVASDYRTRQRLQKKFHHVQLQEHNCLEQPSIVYQVFRIFRNIQAFGKSSRSCTVP